MKYLQYGNYKALLTGIFLKFDTLDIKYCVCGNYLDLPESTTHDVDIWVSDVGLAFKALNIVSAGLSLKIYLANKTANGYNVFLYSCHGASVEIYHIDILQECSWFSFVPLVNKELIAENVKKYNGFFVANDQIETIMHFVYPLVTNGVVKKKYRDKVHKNCNSQFFKVNIEHLFGYEAANALIEDVGSRDWLAVERKKNKLRLNLIINCLKGVVKPTLKDILTFFGSNVSRLIRPSGLFVVFVGLDGAGKTTLINSLDGFFQQGFASGKIKKHYWRPFLLPELGRLIKWFRRKERTEFADCSTEYFDYRISKTRYTLFKSPIYFFKFFYYLFDFMFGRLKYQGAWSRGGVVCFDRYYYDLQVFPERFGFKVPKRMIHFFSLFVPKPDICFYLYAPSKILFERKGEVPELEIIRQTNEYEYLLNNSSNFIKIDTSKSFEETHSKIIRSCLEAMGSRYD